MLAELKLPKPALRLLLPIVLPRVLLRALDPLVLLLATLVAMLLAMLSLAEPLLLLRAWRESLFEVAVGVVDVARERSAIWPHCTFRKRAVAPLPLRCFAATSVLSPRSFSPVCNGGGGGGRGGGLVGQGLLMSVDVGRGIFRVVDVVVGCVAAAVLVDAAVVGLVLDPWLSDELGNSRMVGICLARAETEIEGAEGKRVTVGGSPGDVMGGRGGDWTGTGAGRVGMKAAESSSPPSGALCPPRSL